MAWYLVVYVVTFLAVMLLAASTQPSCSICVGPECGCGEAPYGDYMAFLGAVTFILSIVSVLVTGLAIRDHNKEDS